MRDLIVFLIVIGLLPTAFRKPFFGLLLFSWLAYMRPQDLCWGFARMMRFSFLVSAAMLVGWYVNESRIRKFFIPNFWTRTLIALVLCVSISLAMAWPNYGPTTIRFYFEFLKIIVIAIFTISQVDTKERLKWLLWVICGSLAFYSFKNGLIGLATGGGKIMRGPGGMLEDNNDFALALVMNIPILYYLGRASDTPNWLRKLTVAGVFFTVVTVLLLHSRGGFLAMTATLMALAWRSGKLVQAALVVAGAAGAFFLFAPDHVVERISSIFAKDVTADSSAASRLVTWSISLKMIVDNPFWGIGLHNFLLYVDEYAIRMGMPPGVGHVSHNSYLQIWSEGGTMTFFTYMALFLSVFYYSAWVRRVTRYRPDMQWAYNYGRMLEATMIGFMVGATFLNRGHFDLFYHFIAITACMTLVVRKELAKSPEEIAAEGGQRSRQVTVRRRSLGFTRAPVATVGRTSPASVPVGGQRVLPRW